MQSKGTIQHQIAACSKPYQSKEQVYCSLLSNCYDPNGQEKTGFNHYGKRFNHSKKQCERRYRCWLIEEEEKLGRLMRSVINKIRPCQGYNSEEEINEAIKSDKMLQDIVNITNESKSIHGFTSSVARLIMMGEITQATLIKQIKSIHSKVAKSAQQEEEKKSEESKMEQERSLKLEAPKRSKCLEIKGDEPVQDQSDGEDIWSHCFPFARVASSTNNLRIAQPSIPRRLYSRYLLDNLRYVDEYELMSNQPVENQLSDSMPSNLRFIPFARSYSDISMSISDDFVCFSQNELAVPNLPENLPLGKNAPLIGEMCVICQDEFKEADTTLDLKVCEHQFHSDCIKSWLKKRAICPLCKRKIPN